MLLRVIEWHLHVKNEP